MHQNGEVIRSIQLLTGIIDYCGIPESELVILYDVLESAGLREDCLARVRDLGKSYFGEAAELSPAVHHLGP